MAMIIDAKTIILTLFLIALAVVFGIKFIRAFALQIAQENHDAVMAMEATEQEQRVKRERAADAAAATAFAKVKPILTTSTPQEGASSSSPAGAEGIPKSGSV